jgi:uncharacterized protein YndB with AHSA1/START domain
MIYENDVALTVTRLFTAPRAVVYRAWVELERLKEWWGPKGFIWVNATLDLRPGGLFHYQMRSPAGQTMWGKFVFHEIVAPERLVYTSAFSDPQGNTLRHPASPTWPLEILNTITFSEAGEATEVTLRGVPFNATDEERQTFLGANKNVQQGLKGTLDQLDEYLLQEK